MSGRRIISDGSKVAASTVAMGAVSYVLLFVAARVLSPRELSNFVSTWAVLNTAVLAVVLPADAFAPRFRLEVQRLGFSNWEISRTLRDYANFVSCAGSFILVGLRALGLVTFDWVEVLSASLFLAANCHFGARRAYLISSGDFNRIVVCSLIYLCVSFLGFGILMKSESGTGDLLILIVAVSLLTASVFGRESLTVKDRMSKASDRWHLIRNETTTLRALSSLSFVTLLTLILSNGAVATAHLIGADDRTVIIYAAALNLVLVPCTLLNALTPPIHVRAVEAVRGNDAETFMQLYWRSLVVYGLAVSMVVLAMTFAGQFALNIYLTDDHNSSRVELLGVAVAESIATLTVLPRIFLVSLGRASEMMVYWFLGLTFFGAALFIPCDPMARLIAAPLVASTFILVAGSVRLRKIVSTDSMLAPKSS
jgi:hypothetical protein